MRILVLNVNRMGDQLQALPFYWALKQKYPDAHLTVLVDRVGEKDQVVRWLSPPVDEFLPLDLERLKKHAGADADVAQASGYVKELVEQVRSRSVDLLVNVSHGAFSALLMNLFRTPGTKLLGHVMEKGKFRAFYGDWLAYLFTLVDTRRLNRFHLVDLYIRGCGLDPLDRLPPLPVPVPDLEGADAFLSRSGWRMGEPLIAVQPGASEYRKRWEAERFAEAVRLLHERHGWRSVILGAGSERGIWTRMQPLLPAGTVDGFGTTMDQAKAILKRASVLVTNDTGPMHVAASLGTPCVVISVGSVFYPETFGYATGNLVLQANVPCAPCTENLTCNDTVCHSRVTPEDVVTAVDYLLDGRAGTANGTRRSTDGAGEWRAGSARMNGRCTFFRTERDSDGLLMCVPLKRLAAVKEDVLALAYRELWKSAFAFKNTEAAWADLKSLIDLWYGWVNLAPISFQPERTELELISTRCREGQDIARDLEVALFQGADAREQARGIVDRLALNDQDIVNQGYRVPTLQPLLRQYRFERERLQTGSPLDWAQLSQIHLGALERRCQILSLFLARMEDRAQG